MILEVQRAVALGSKYGLKAIPMFADASVETPEIDSTAMEGAIGIVDFGKYYQYFQERNYLGCRNDCPLHHDPCRRVDE